MSTPTTFINCTPHAITVRVDGVDTTFAPSGAVPRVNTVVTNAAPIGGFPVASVAQGAVDGIPAPQDGVFYIVSAMVAQATDRKDVVAPNTTAAIRNDKGHIVAVPGFVVY